VPKKDDGTAAIALYLPGVQNIMPHHATFSLENFKKSVLLAGGGVNISVKFLKDGVAARTYNGSAKNGKVRKAILIPKSKIKEVIRKINKRKY